VERSTRPDRSTPGCSWRCSLHSFLRHWPRSGRRDTRSAPHQYRTSPQGIASAPRTMSPRRAPRRSRCQLPGASATPRGSRTLGRSTHWPLSMHPFQWDRSNLRQGPQSHAHRSRLPQNSPQQVCVRVLSPDTLVCPVPLHRPSVHTLAHSLHVPIKFTSGQRAYLGDTYSRVKLDLHLLSTGLAGTTPSDQGRSRCPPDRPGHSSSTLHRRSLAQRRSLRGHVAATSSALGSTCSGKTTRASSLRVRIAIHRSDTSGATVIRHTSHTTSLFPTSWRSVTGPPVRRTWLPK
jgi:hypothetical protein